ncbi:coat protein [Clostridium sp. 19966]|uniref:major capsid protein n=1 Tax=Clostridium sp. 19966 TaxID=2768166 RepID=UPI0028DF74E9|nr:major capsid protein [Clostridium sp. 19966]MDT8715443.1 coat protein [Clostridium sp. 19966]
MAGTKLSDIIVPELFNPYVINRTMELSALVQSGIIVNNSEFDSLASQAAPLINMPFFEDLSGESEQIIEDEDLEADKITSNKDVAAILRRAKMWSATDLSAALAGSDPMAAIGGLVAGFWNRDMQKELVSILSGIFAAASMSTNLSDISSLTGNAAKWSTSAFVDAQQLLGDAQQILTGIMMHSATKSALKKQNLIETIRPSDSADFDVYQDKRVIVDDGCPVDTTNGIYTTYLFGQGAFALGNGNPVGFVPTETDRDKKKGSGVDYLINRKQYIIHPRGVKFTNADVAKTEGPSRTELTAAANWERVYDAKQIRIVAFKHKI